eukprot:58167-Karenia_brevis.AAC.1
MASVEADLGFALEGNARMGPLVQKWRNRQMRRLGRLTKALRPLDVFALTQRPGHAHFVSQ